MLDGGNGIQRQTRARQLGGTRGHRKEGVRSRCSEGEVIYTTCKPPEVRELGYIGILSHRCFSE